MYVLMAQLLNIITWINNCLNSMAQLLKPILSANTWKIA